MTEIWLWEYHRFSGRLSLSASAWSADILQTHDGHDITRLRGIDHASIIRVHLDHRPIRSYL